MLVNIEVDLKDIEGITTDFQRGIEKGMKLATIFAEGASKKRFNTPDNLNVRTGRLRTSIIGISEKSGDTYVGSVGTDVIYGRIHELGGTITPKNGPYLKFQIDGRWMSVKSVTIPARPFLLPAITENIDRIEEIILNSIYKEVNDVK